MSGNSRFTCIACALPLVAALLCGCLNPQNSWTRGTTGLTLAQGEDAVIIKAITPRTGPADASPLPGDAVVEVDGLSMTGLPPEAVTEALTGPVGGSVTITVKRAEELLTFEVTRFRYHRPERRTLQSRRLDRRPLTAAELSAPEGAPEPSDEPK